MPSANEIYQKRRQEHVDALHDTSGDAYTAFQGWVLTCLWCDYRALGKTKREALDGMRSHYNEGLRLGVEIR